MLTIKLSPQQWELYGSATAKDADTLNKAANRAVLDVLKEMQADGVSLDAALNTALSTAREAFYRLVKVGAFDTEPLQRLEHEVTRQFAFRKD